MQQLINKKKYLQKMENIKHYEKRNKKARECTLWAAKLEPYHYY